MKIRWLSILLLAGFLGSASLAFADVRVGVQFNDSYEGRREYPRDHFRGYYGPYHYRRPGYAYRPVYVQPVVVSQPVYYAPAPTPPPVFGTPLSGNYGTDLAALHERVSRLRAILQRQDQKGQITKEQYNRFMNTLDGIEHDEHARAYDRGGNLTSDDFADLYRRANDVDQDMEVALAE